MRLTACFTSSIQNLWLLDKFNSSNTSLPIASSLHISAYNHSWLFKYICYYHQLHKKTFEFCLIKYDYLVSTNCIRPTELCWDWIFLLPKQSGTRCKNFPKRTSPSSKDPNLHDIDPYQDRLLDTYM